MVIQNSKLKIQNSAAAAAAVLAGLALGAALGLGLGMNLLIVGLLGPFILFAAFALPHWSVVVYVVLVYADLLSILVRFHNIPPLARFAGFVLLVAVLGRRVVKRQAVSGANPVADAMTGWLVAYGLLLALGLLYAQAPDLVMVEVIEYIRNFLTYLLVINALTTLGRVRGAMWALLGMAAVLGTLTVFQTVTGRFDLDFGGLAQAHISGITETTDAPRPGGTIGDPNYYGQSLLIILPLAFYVAFRGRWLAARVAGVLIALILAAAIIFTYSRGDTVALAALLVVAVLYKRPRIQYILGGMVALGLVLSLLPPTYYDRIGTLFSVLQGSPQAIIAESSLLGRAGAASAAISMFADHPLLGVGRGNYPLHELDYIEGTNLASKSTGIPPHDLYLEVASEQGLAGLIIMGGILVTMVRALIDMRRRFLRIDEPGQADLATWLGIGLFSYMVSSLFLHGAYLYMLWLQVALVVALRHVALEARPVSVPQETSYRIVRGIRVREEQVVSNVVTSPLTAPGMYGVPSGALPAGETAGKSPLGLLSGLLVTLIAIGLLILAGNYAVRRDAAQAPQALAATATQTGGVAGSSSSSGAGSSLHPQPTPYALTFPQTGLQVTDPFLGFWQNNGGLAIFGYPVSPEMLEVSDGGRILRVQYFERARLELHPEFLDAAKQVQAGALGTEVPISGQIAASLPTGLQGKQVVLHEQTPSTPPLFAAFWRHTGQTVLGYPISPVIVDTLPDGKQLFVQYFEKARLEYHPEGAATGNDVQISRLGALLYTSKYAKKR
jgi:putative inorganic carbon (HCO3(-)) transporter